MEWQPVQLDALARVECGDRDHAEQLWRSSGAAALTDPDVAEPVRLVQRVRAVAAWLDERGARLHERTNSEGLGLLAERGRLLGLGAGGRTSCGGATRLVRTADGWIAVSLARPDDLGLVPAWLEQPLDGDAWAAVEAAAASRSSLALRDRATLLGLACSVVGERAADDAPALAMRLGDAPPRPLVGATVVNLASLWAGPLAAHLLHRLGATVVDVESGTRPDGAHATPAFHRLLHDGHDHVTVAFGTNEGRDELLELISSADIVIEGSRPRALEQLGVDAAELTATGPAAWLSITAHGRTGTDAQRIGYGDDCAAAGGLVGHVGGEPRFVADAIADPLAGLVTAAAGAQLLESGGRWLTDIALARVAAACADGG